MPIRMPPDSITVSAPRRRSASASPVFSRTLAASQGKRDALMALASIPGRRSSNSWLPGTAIIGARAWRKLSASIICCPSKYRLSSEGAIKSPACSTRTGAPVARRARSATVTTRPIPPTAPFSTASMR
jgi:hypothetical protein